MNTLSGILFPLTNSNQQWSPNPLISHDHFQLSWKNENLWVFSFLSLPVSSFWHFVLYYALLIPSLLRRHVAVTIYIQFGKLHENSKCTLTPFEWSSQWQLAEGKACQDVPKWFVCSQIASLTKTYCDLYLCMCESAWLTTVMISKQGIFISCDPLLG